MEITKKSTMDTSYEPIQRPIATKTEKTPLLPSEKNGNTFCSINKPLIPLKFFYFTYYGATATMEAFVLLYLKQLGMTIAEISIMNIIMPFFRCSGPIISGMIADKIGHPKTVLIANLIIAFLFANSMLLFIPRTYIQDHTFKEVRIECNTFNSSCIFHCPFNNSLDYLNNLCCSLHSMNWCGSYSDFHNSTSLEPLWSPIPTTSKCSIMCNNYTYEWNPPAEIENTNDSALVFTLSLIFNIACHAAVTSIHRITDSTAIKMANANNSNFGRERTFATLSYMTVSPLVGVLINYFTPEGALPNYDLVFYTFDVLVIMALIASTKLDVVVLSPETAVWKKTMDLLKKGDVIVFTCILLVLGTATGFEGRYGNLFLDEIKAPTIMISLKVTVIGFVGIPSLLTANWWIKKFGSMTFILTAFVGHLIYTLTYSILINPWYALCIEVTTILTYHLLWVAVVQHAHDISPEGLTATVIATAGAIHFALGEGVGSLIGGFIMSAYGPRWAFRAIAIIIAVVGPIYAIYLYLRWRKKNRQKQEGL